jgi:hypothetical protein
MAVGYTPFVTKLEARKHKVKMTLAGYADWTPGDHSRSWEAVNSGCTDGAFTKSPVNSINNMDPP